MYLLLIFAFCCASALAESAQYYAPEDAAFYFEDFIETFDKYYADEHEKAARFEIFKAKLEEINRYNKESNHTVFGVTQFSDLTTEEFIQRYTGLRLAAGSAYCDTIVTDAQVPDADAPEALDWRLSNLVTRVKSQGTCGSCFSFSTTGHLEALYAIKHQQLVELSEQQIIDCDTGSLGCLGGYPASSMQTLMRLGSMTEQSYPYEMLQGQCRSDPNQAVLRVTSCSTYDLHSQEKVKQLLRRVGPIAIGVKAEALGNYHGGILSDAACSIGEVNHAVLLVGYGTENNVPYWIVKNSWASTWGENGYFRMERSDNPEGACGMLNKIMTTAEIV